MRRSVVFLPLALALMGLAVQDVRGAIIVPGTANIFGAGHAVAPEPGGGGGGDLPPHYSFAPGGGKTIQFTHVTGEVSPIQPYFCGPDGYDTFPTDIDSYGGISGIVHRGDNPGAMGTVDQTGRALVLTGVFLDDLTPAETNTPERLDFSLGGDAFLSLAPKIGQTFFVGDGLTGTGTGSLQTFFVPETATRLFLGFADAGDFVGLPGAYSDNSGYLTVDLQIIPEPTSVAVWSLLAVAGIGFGWWRRRR